MKRAFAKILYGGVLVVAMSGASCRHAKPAVQSAGVRLDVSDSIIAAARIDTFRLGRVKNGEKIIKEFAVRNAGEKPFVFSVKSDCGCVASQFEQQPVLPGQSTAVSVSFDSRGYYGTIFKRVEIITSLTPQPLAFYITATVVE